MELFSSNWNYFIPMKFHNYWETVLGSRVKIQILRALCRYPGKKFTVRELARIAGVSHTPVLKAVGDLQKMNLLLLEKHGTANLLTLNQQSYLYSAVKSFFSQETESRNKLIKRIRDCLPEVDMAVLFGSIQKGTERTDSDIDLLIVAHKKEVKAALEECRKKISQEFGNLLSPVIFSEKEFKQARNQPFAKDLQSSYTIIKGQDLIKSWWKHD